MVIDIIEKQIASCKEKLNFWENQKQIYLRIYPHTEIFSDDDIVLCTYKLYFRLGNIQLTAEKLINMGFSMKGKKTDTRKLIHKDVSFIIENNTIQDEELQNAVRKMLKNHRDFINCKCN